MLNCILEPLSALACLGTNRQSISSEVLRFILQLKTYKVLRIALPSNLEKHQ